MEGEQAEYAADEWLISLGDREMSCLTASKAAPILLRHRQGEEMAPQPVRSEVDTSRRVGAVG
jgi:hypothetical protein